jgi:hypothetical protein
MKFQTLFAAALGPLAAIFAGVTAADTNNGTAISTINGTRVSTNNGTAISTKSSTAGLHCDANCAHRLIFRSGYNGASDGVGTVFGVCDAYEWCYNDAKEWCPDVISSTLTRIASQVKTDVMAGIDYNNVNNLTLLSTVLTVNARSTRTAISAAQSLLKVSPLSCSADQVTDLEKIRWLMAQQEDPIDYDADTFDEYFAEQDGEALQKRAGRVCNGDVVLYNNVPWLRRFFEGARKLLSKVKSKMLRSAIEEPAIDQRGLFTPRPLTPEGIELEPALEENYVKFKQWWVGPKEGKGGIETKGGLETVEEWLDEVPDAFEEVPPDFLQRPGAPEPFYPPPRFPPDSAEGVPPGKIPLLPDRPDTPPAPPENPPVPAHQAPRPPYIHPPPPKHQVPRPPTPNPPPAPNPPPEAPPVTQGAEGVELYRAVVYDEVNHIFDQLVRISMGKRVA